MQNIQMYEYKKIIFIASHPSGTSLAGNDALINKEGIMLTENFISTFADLNLMYERIIRKKDRRRTKRD